MTTWAATEGMPTPLGVTWLRHDHEAGVAALEFRRVIRGEKRQVETWFALTCRNQALEAPRRRECGRHYQAPRFRSRATVDLGA